ncbi:phage tail protein [Streptomyces gamaensis]|uniref:Phage tail protein n=1 Tax=Streptomyces gamaensis TaxID=1763542 RepID=A0ABW0Z0Q1_9ACTN
MADTKTQTGGAFAANRFTFQLEGLQLEQLKSVSGVEIGVEVRQAPAVDAKTGLWSMHKTAGTPKTPSIRITRSMEKSPTVTDWIKKVYGQGNVSDGKKQASIVFMTDEGDKGQKITVNLINAWVSSWSASDLSSDSANGVVEETFVVECDRIEMAA